MNLTTKLLTLLVIVFMVLILFSCSSTKKMKKKCLDCPEFSYSKPAPASALIVNENI